MKKLRLKHCWSVFLLSLLFLAIANSVLAQQGASESAASWVAKLELPQERQRFIADLISTSHDSKSWCGEHDSDYVAVAAQRLPTGAARRRSKPLMISTAGALAVNQIVLHKSLADEFSQRGMTDTSARDEALRQISNGMQFAGRVKGATRQAEISGDFAVALVQVDRKAVVAQLVSPNNLAKSRELYRDALQSRMSKLASRQQWAATSNIYEHLAENELRIPAIDILAARCFIEAGDQSRALSILQSIHLMSPELPVEVIAQVGELAVRIDTPDSGKLAEKAYREAIRRLQ